MRGASPGLLKFIVVSLLTGCLDSPTLPPLEVVPIAFEVEEPEQPEVEVEEPEQPEEPEPEVVTPVPKPPPPPQPPPKPPKKPKSCLSYTLFGPTWGPTDKDSQLGLWLTGRAEISGGKGVIKTICNKYVVAKKNFNTPCDEIQTLDFNYSDASWKTPHHLTSCVFKVQTS